MREAVDQEERDGPLLQQGVYGEGLRVPAAGSRVESLRNALEAAKKAKQRLFEKLADREIEWAVFLERKKGYDAEIGRLEQEISDAGLAERIERDADDEARERADVARSFLDVGEMTEEIWERFCGCAFYPVKHEVTVSHEMDDVVSMLFQLGMGTQFQAVGDF